MLVQTGVSASRGFRTLGCESEKLNTIVNLFIFFFYIEHFGINQLVTA